MASSVEEDSPKRSSIFRCPVCLDMFSRPKVLSCGHSFCEEPCLSSIASGAGFLPCPECRIVTRLPANGICGLPTNFSLLRAISDGDCQDTRCDTHRQPKNITCYTCDTNICKECVNESQHCDHDSEISRILETTRVANNSFTDFTRMLTVKRDEVHNLRASFEAKRDEVGKSILQAAALAREEIDEIEGALLMKLELETEGDSQRFASVEDRYGSLLSATCGLQKHTDELIDAIKAGNTERLTERYTLESDVISLYNDVIAIAKEPLPSRSKLVVFRPGKHVVSIGELKSLPAPPSRPPPRLDDPELPVPQLDVSIYAPADPNPLLDEGSSTQTPIYENLTPSRKELGRSQSLRAPLPPNRGHTF